MNSFKTFLMLIFLGAVGYGVYRTLHTQSAHRSAPGIDTSTPEVELKIGQQIEFPTITSPSDIAATNPNDRLAPSNTIAPISAPPLPIAKSTLPNPTLSVPPLGVNSQISDSTSPPLTATNTIAPAPSNLRTVAEPTNNGSVPAAPGPGFQNPTPASVAASNNSLANVAPLNNLATNALTQNPAATQPIGPGLSVSPYPFVREELKPLLAQNKLLEALQVATKMYDDSRLAPQEQKELQDLLNQLAGSVIYSRDHLFAKPHIVTNGESLTTIAEKYRIPPGLLAKINCYTSATQLRAGDQLKVVPGPFTADISLSKKRLTVFVNDCYAGSFELLMLGQDTPKSSYREQTYVIQHKTDNVLYRNGQVPAGDPKNPLGNFLLAVNEDIAIHGVGAEVPPNDPRGSIRLSARDVEDVYDILSVGSRVTIKR